MKKVIDSNYLSSPKLYDFLNQSKDNIAVLTEYVAIEAYKGEKLESICESMEMLSHFSNQVVVVKNTIDICEIDLDDSILPDMIIDHSQTKSFLDFCNDLEKSKTNFPHYKKLIKEHQEKANQQILRIKSDAPQLLAGYQEVKNLYTETDLKKMRQGSIFGKEISSKIISNILTTTAILMMEHPSCNKIPRFQTFTNHFLLRNALCAKLLFIDWVSKGSPKSVKIDKLANDIVDINFSTFSLYFDGLLSEDKKLLSVYENAKKFLPLLRQVDHELFHFKFYKELAHL